MFRRIFTIALNTFRESVRSKILYSVICFGILVCGTASAFGRVTIGDQGLVVETFGLFCTSLFSLLFALISGSMLFAKEISKKTIFTILARPVERHEILVGKWLGLFLTSGCLVMLMNGALALYLGAVFTIETLPVFYAGFFMLMELLIVCSLVMFFSAIVVTPLFIGLFSLAVFLAGRNASYILHLTGADQDGSPLSLILSVFHSILPKFEFLALSDRLINGEVLGAGLYGAAFSYTIGYSLVVLVISSLIFSRREFN